MCALNYEKDGDDYHKIRHAEIFGNSRLIESWSRYAAYKYFPCIVSTESILEIGAGTGINVAYVKNLASVTVVEPSQLAREHCARLGLKTYRSLDDLPPSSKFDRILLRHVLEHVIEPSKMLAGISKLLTVGGQLILVLPIESPFAKVQQNDLNHHLYCWNLQTISNLLQALGYKTNSCGIHYYNGRQLFYWVLRLFGINAYAMALTALGVIRRAGEYIIIASTDGA